MVTSIAYTKNYETLQEHCIYKVVAVVKRLLSEPNHSRADERKSCSNKRLSDGIEWELPAT